MESCKDVFTGSTYALYFCGVTSNDIILANNLVPVVSNKKVIKYKDAEEILKTNNSVIIKKWY